MRQRSPASHASGGEAPVGECAAAIGYSASRTVSSVQPQRNRVASRPCSIALRTMYARARRHGRRSVRVAAQRRVGQRLGHRLGAATLAASSAPVRLGPVQCAGRERQPGESRTMAQARENAATAPETANATAAGPSRLRKRERPTHSWLRVGRAAGARAGRVCGRSAPPRRRLPATERPDRTRRQVAGPTGGDRHDISVRATRNCLISSSLRRPDPAEHSRRRSWAISAFESAKDWFWPKSRQRSWAAGAGSECLPGRSRIIQRQGGRRRSVAKPRRRPRRPAQASNRASSQRFTLRSGTPTCANKGSSSSRKAPVGDRARPCFQRISASRATREAFRRPAECRSRAPQPLPSSSVTATRGVGRA